MGPLIGIYDSTNTSILGTWDAGTIKAQVPTTPLTVNIWNNKAGAADVSDLKSPEIAVFDYNGLTADTDVPKDKWVQVYVASVDGSTPSYTAIGGSVTKTFRANSNVGTEYVIKGTANDGDPLAYPQNVATVNIRLEAPLNSIPGDKTFKIRIIGYYT